MSLCEKFVGLTIKTRNSDDQVLTMHDFISPIHPMDINTLQHIVVAGLYFVVWIKLSAEFTLTLSHSLASLDASPVFPQ